LAPTKIDKTPLFSLSVSQVLGQITHSALPSLYLPESKVLKSNFAAWMPGNPAACGMITCFPNLLNTKTGQRWKSSRFIFPD